MSKTLADSGLGAGNQLLGVDRGQMVFSTHEDGAGDAYGPGETDRGTKVGAEVVQETSSSLSFVAGLIFILDVMGLLQSPLPGNGNGSTRLSWVYFIFYGATVCATVFSALAVVILLFGGTSCAGRFNTLMVLLVSIAAFNTMLGLMFSVFITWIQHARPVLHMSFVVAVVVLAISTSYYYRPGRHSRRGITTEGKTSGTAAIHSGGTAATVV